MIHTSTRWRHLLALFVILQASIFSFSQSPLSIREIVNILDETTNEANQKFLYIPRELVKNNSSTAFATIRELETHVGSNHYYNTRFFLLKRSITMHFKGVAAKEELQKLCEKAVSESYSTGDKYLIFFANQSSGSTMYACQELELAATYLLKADEIRETLEETLPYQKGIWLLLGEVFYHTREYENSINYIKKGLDNTDTVATPLVFRVRYLNTIGQGYQQLNKLDSALLYFEKSSELAGTLDIKTTKDIWIAINSGFIGQVMFLRNELDKAKQYLRHDYEINKNAERKVAAYSLQWLARINLAEGKKDSALGQIREALEFLRSPDLYNIQRVNYLQHVYRTATDIFKAFDNTDSVYHYANLYAHLHDSLEKVAFRSSLKILKTRLDNEKNYQVIANLKKEKKDEEQKRNVIIVFIVLVSIIALLYINKLRIRYVHKEQMALQEKKAADLLAREQLQSLTQSLVEKANLVDELQLQLNNRNMSAERQELTSAISSLTILTDEDWNKFRSLFEQLHPGFFINLQERVADITQAEMRMAALTRLHLSTQQIATILGISANSVYKTKQRLRQRLGLDTDSSIEEAITLL